MTVSVVIVPMGIRAVTIVGDRLDTGLQFHARAEIGKLERHSEDKLCLVDIHEMQEDANTPDRDALLARLHLRTADGEWLTGIDANIRAWHHTPFRRLWQVLGWPLIRPCSSAAYELWLRWRARRA